jgi:hypothetical protein
MSSISDLLAGGVMERFWRIGNQVLEWFKEDWGTGILFQILVSLAAIALSTVIGLFLFEFLIWVFCKARARTGHKLPPLKIKLSGLVAILLSAGLTVWFTGLPFQFSFDDIPWLMVVLAGPISILFVMGKRLAERTRMCLILADPSSIP